MEIARAKKSKFNINFSVIALIFEQIFNDKIQYDRKKSINARKKP